MGTTRATTPTDALDRLRLLIVQSVLRAWGKLSWDLSETIWKSNGAPSGGLKTCGPVCHESLADPFHDANPTGQDATDAVAEPEHEEWVMQEWKRFEGGVLP